MTTWSIGQAAEKCGLSQHTLRWYERIGLVGIRSVIPNVCVFHPVGIRGSRVRA